MFARFSFWTVGLFLLAPLVSSLAPSAHAQRDAVKLGEALEMKVTRSSPSVIPAKAGIHPGESRSSRETLQVKEEVKAEVKGKVKVEGESSKKAEVKTKGVLK